MEEHISAKHNMHSLYVAKSTSSGKKIRKKSRSKDNSAFSPVSNRKFNETNSSLRHKSST